MSGERAVGGAGWAARPGWEAVRRIVGGVARAWTCAGVVLAGLALGPMRLPAQSRGPDTTGVAVTVPGSELEVYLMTMGQGELLWERFGHNALGIRDPRRGTDVVYNWGMFSFDQPGFLPRFLRGEMLYWMAPYDAAGTVAAYAQINRSVTVQRLNLTPQQKQALQTYVEWNVRDENKFYPYDYYRDNCSTRVRDALDRVLDGAIRRATDTITTAFTYRDHSLRLMDGMFWTRTGIDLGLGPLTDHPISAWESMFIPMEVQRRLRDVRVLDASGTLVPLVASEDTVFAATRPPERLDVPRPVGGALVAGLASAALLLALGFRLRGPVAATALAMAWGIGAGFFGLLLLLLWTATAHVAAHANQNLLFVHPLWLAVASLIPFVRSKRRVRQTVLLLVRGCAILTVVGAVVALTPAGQPSGAIAAFAVPVNLASYLLVLRVVYFAQQSAQPPATPA